MDSQAETVASTIVEGLRINICGHMYIRWYHITTDKTKICMIIIMHTYISNVSYTSVYKNTAVFVIHIHLKEHN